MKVSTLNLQKIAFSLFFAVVLNLAFAGGSSICQAFPVACSVCEATTSSAVDCACCTVKGGCASQKSEPTTNLAEPLCKAISVSLLTTFLVFVAGAQLPLLWRLFAGEIRAKLARGKSLPSSLLRPPRIFILYRSLLI